MPDIKILYEELLSGDSVPISRVGHVRSPKLSEMYPSKGIGWQQYHLYIYFLRAGKEQINEIMHMNVESDDKLFEEIISNDAARIIYMQAINFFFEENVTYNESYRLYVVTAADDDNKVIGLINQENFDYVRAAILLMNYITADKTNVTTKYSSPEAKAAWDKVQEYLAKQEIKKKEDEGMSFGNMMSKLCSIHPSINFLNVNELTVFQFYDAFFQTCYMRSVGFTEAVVSTNGSKDFKYSDWLKPIKNYT